MFSNTLLFCSLALSACAPFDEHLTIRDIQGRITLPGAAGTRTFQHADGTEETLTDPRLIGPVYIGVYPKVVTGQYSYPYPEEGPAFSPGLPGDTYPYGGTSLGDIRFPCLEYLQCKVVSGRYVDFDSMVTWFNDVLEKPMLTADGDPVTNGDQIAQTCFDLLNYTSEDEIQLTATRDNNGDGALDALDLDFVYNEADDVFEGEFTIWQQEYFEDRETGQGFSLWGWMDAPHPDTQLFSTCDPSEGREEVEYTAQFKGGRAYRDLLNHPVLYVDSGDWVSQEPYVFQSPDDADVELNIDLFLGASN